MQIARNFCSEFSIQSFEKAGCAVCGELKLLKGMTLLRESAIDTSVLISSFTRQEWHSQSEPIVPLQEPALATSCRHICTPCYQALLCGNVPLMSLANSMWLGEVRSILKSLTFLSKSY